MRRGELTAVLGSIAPPRSVRPRGSLWARAVDVATLPGDSRDERLHKRLQLSMALASIPAVAAWGLLFVAQGHARVALWQAGYVAATALMLAHLAATKRWEAFRLPHPALVLVLPFALHWELGGFRGSGGAILWCLLAPVAAMMFGGAKKSLPFFVAMVALIALGWLREGALAPARYELSPNEASLHFAFNTIGFVAFLYLSTRYFVSRIEEERARSDKLLANVLPASIAERLKRQEQVIAERHERVTVLFCDVVGFTRLAARLDPEDLVRLLDEVFRELDAIADRCGVEKIKTIGDAYMLVGGAPERCDDHARRVADAAIAIRDFVARFARERRLDLAMRIGIHTGAVVAGVIGRRKFTYDLWGDTVNTASRMESHGAPGRIHVSVETRAALGDDFAFEPRGLIDVKGKGTMPTYWLEGSMLDSP